MPTKVENTLTKGIIPVYSPSATIGINTIHFSVFSCFMPVGIGEKPHPVHESWLETLFQVFCPLITSRGE